MRVLCYLAVKSLLRSRLSLAFLLLAVTAGVAFQIPNAANINGYTEELLRQGVSRSTGHLIIEPTGSRPMDGVAALTRRLRTLPFVRGVTARDAHAGVLFRKEDYRAVRAVGIDPAVEDRVAGFCKRVARGRCFDTARPRQAVAGSRLAEVLGLRVGDRLKLVMPYEDLGEIKFARESLKLAGVLEGGGSFRADYDLFIPIRDMYRIMGWDDEATRVSIFVDRRQRAEAHAPRVRALLPPKTSLKTFWESEQFVANAVAGNRALFSISMMMVIFAVGIPVLALLYIRVLQDRRQIATLSAIGFTRASLFTVYLIKAALVGGAGAALGVGAGLGLCSYFDAYPIFQYHGFEVRPAVDATVVLVPAGVLLLVTVLAGIAPAIKAARANPSLELREG